MTVGGGQALPRESCNSVKTHCIKLDRDLTLSDHVTQQAINRLSGRPLRFRTLLPESVKLQLAQAFELSIPLLLFCIREQRF